MASDFLGRAVLPRRDGHHITCQRPECKGCDTVEAVRRTRVLDPDSLAVACPFCGAAVGAACTVRGGRALLYCHPSRWFAAEEAAGR